MTLTSSFCIHLNKHEECPNPVCNPAGIVYHAGVPCHKTEKQPVDGRNEFTYCSTCGDWFKPVGKRTEQDIRLDCKIYGRRIDGQMVGIGLTTREMLTQTEPGLLSRKAEFEEA